MPRVAIVLALVSPLAGCGRDDLVLLPPLDGYATVMAAPARATAIEVRSLPATALRFDFPAEPEDRSHGALLLYRDAPDVPEGTVRLSLDPKADRLPLPDRVLSLDEARAWVEGEAAPWEERRIEPPACLEVDQTVVDIGPHGDVRQLLPWAEGSVMVVAQIRGEAIALAVVRPDGARVIPAPVPPELDELAATTDENGHLWLAYGWRDTATGTVAMHTELRMTQVNRELDLVRGFRVLAGVPGSIGASPRAMVMGLVGGRREVFVLAEADRRADPPHLLWWREGQASAERLPWPAPVDPVSECLGVGLFRTYLERRGPRQVSWMFRQGAIVHWDDGVPGRETIERGACGGVLLDDTLEGALAVMSREKLADSPVPPNQVRERIGDAWSGEDTGEAVINGLALVRWQGRVFATGDLGQIVEIQRRREGGVRLCPPIELEPSGERLGSLRVVGDALVAAGPAPGPGAPTKIRWLRRR